LLAGNEFVRLNGNLKMSEKPPRTCALCQKVRILKDSHIVPEFLHEPLYDEIHRFHTYGLEGAPETGLEQKGQREELLCKECEQRLSVYEGWASHFYRGALAAFADTARSEIPYGKALKFTRIDASGMPTTASVPRMLYTEGFDYTKMKLFLLSILWRMGVSKLHFFSGVTLGFHEKRIRRMLLSNDPGKAEEYACQLRLIELNGTLIADCQMQPRQYDHFGKKRCKFFSTGFRFDFTVSNHPPDPQSLELFCVKPSSNFVCWVDSVLTHPDLQDELGRLGRSMKWVEAPANAPSPASNAELLP
jgi:hypothetical protein